MSMSRTTLVLALIVAALPAAGQQKPAKGKLLVADRQVVDPNFGQTVVLLLDVDKDNGAMGLIVNRKSDVRLSLLLPEVRWLADRAETVYFGGPVEVERLWMLQRAPEKPEQAQWVFGDV